MSSDPQWKIRVVGYEEADPTELVANPRNWRRHPGSQRKAMRAALEGVGLVAAVIVNRTTGHILDGHMRVEEAVKAGQHAVPVLYVELSEQDEAQALATFDPLGAMAVQDTAALAELLASASSATAMNDALASVARDSGLLNAMLATGAGDTADSAEAEALDEALDEALAPEATRPAAEARHALAIVLSLTDKRRWDAYKASLGVAGDTLAFLRLLDTVAGDD